MVPGAVLVEVYAPGRPVYAGEVEGWMPDYLMGYD